MLLKPLSHNVFFATLIVASLVLVSAALAEPVFGSLFEQEGVQVWLRQVVVPMFTA